MDITNFMSWFVSQCVRIFAWFFNLLDSITFAGTSLLKVMITVSILVPLLFTLITIPNNLSVRVERSDRIRDTRNYRKTIMKGKNKNG